jgi:Immunity protein 35
MRNLAQAKQDAAAHLDRIDIPPVQIIESATQEHEVGWFFYYQSKRFLESGELSEALVGNAPLFIRENSLEVKRVAAARE